MARINFVPFVTLAALLTAVAGCTVHKQDPAPALSGPSSLGTTITVQVSPDVLTQDGASQSVVTIIAIDSNGQPLRNLSVRVDITVNGVIADFGTLSARNVVTDASGRATLIYTAPPAPGIAIDSGTIVSIEVTPADTNFSNQVATRTAQIRLVPPGIIIPPSNGLTPRFTATPAAPTDHQVVLFDASASTSTNATILSYQWNFGDGGSGSGITAQHSYNSAGTFAVTLTVTDSVGRTNSTTQTLTVAVGAGPTATFVVSPTAPLVGQQVNFNASASTAAAGRTITSYQWDFGDGNSASGVQASHSYSAAGTFVVLLTVTDDAGHKATANQSVTVATGNPTADFTFNPSSPSVGQPVSFDASTSQAAPGRTIVSYAWLFDDGTNGSGKTISHTYAAAATYNVRLTVTDNQGQTGSVTKAVTVK